MISVTISICCLIFLGIVLIFNFLKPRLKIMSNKLFSVIMITNTIGIIIDIIGFVFLNIFNIESYINILIAKVYLLYYLVYIFAFMLYIYEVSTQNLNKNLKKALLLFAVLLIIILLLPLEIYFNNGVGYTTGMSVNMTYFFGFSFTGIMIFYLLKYIKSIGYKKYMPLFAFVILTITSAIIQKSNPEITLMLLSNSIVTFLLFFTIENPDVKMLEEVYRAKKISDSSNEEKIMFLHNMTSDIRIITKEIDLSADNILNETDNKKIDVEVINNNAREIKRNTAKFTTMTNEMLDISSIDSANIKVYNEKYNIKLILKEMITIYKSKAESKGIEFQSDIATNIPEYLYGDSLSIKNALNTILDNAIEYTDKGYVELRLNTIIKNDICRLIITIEDSGLGIKADDMEPLFNKHKKEIDGDDLKKDLYTARKLITLMGGTLIPSSTYGTGTTMKIVLDQKIVETSSKLDKYENSFEKKKVLIVDDNEASIKIINKYLKDTNIELESVKLGKECLDKIRNKEKYDLILLDEEMTPINGLEVMQKLQKIKYFNTKVILLTKNNDYEYTEEFKKYGFTDFILKPIDRDIILSKLNKYL